MSLQNRNDAEAQRMMGVNLFDDPIDVPLGQFTLLENWVYKGLYSLGKKRGVADVGAGAQMNVALCGTTNPDAVVVCAQTLIACDEVVLCTVGAGSIIACN